MKDRIVIWVLWRGVLVRCWRGSEGYKGEGLIYIYEIK
jgi:hypothetical protein